MDVIPTRATDFKSVYATYLRQVEEYLHNLPSGKTLPHSLYDPFRYVLSAGGKRLRPVLTMMSAVAAGGKAEDALGAGAAIEILHNFTLVHDDIMDKSPLRRGNPTVHTRWNEATAILAGDVMMGYAYHILLHSTPATALPAVMSEFTQGFIEVCEGQALDLEFHHRQDVSMADYLQMIEKKTAWLLQIAAVMGGMVGNGSPEHLAALRLYARSIGIAFQIQDDLLDLTADGAELGKSIGHDIVEGKKTYLIVRAQEVAQSAEHRSLLDEFYERGGLPQERIPAIRTMMQELGVLADAQACADQYFTTAQQAITILPSAEGRAMLSGVIDILNERKK